MPDEIENRKSRIDRRLRAMYALLLLLLLVSWPMFGAMSAPPDSTGPGCPYLLGINAAEQDSLVRSLLIRGRREGLSSRTITLPGRVAVRFWGLDRTMQVAVTLRIQRSYYMTATELRNKLGLEPPEEGFVIWVFPSLRMMWQWLKLRREVYAVSFGDRYIFVPYEVPMPVVMHEMTHIFTHAAYLPEWFGEGLASYLFHDHGYPEYRAIFREIKRRLGKKGFRAFCVRVIRERSTERAMWEMVGTTYEQLRRDVEHASPELQAR